MKEHKSIHRVVCDGPKCAARHALDAPVLIAEFDEEAVKVDPNAMPDAFFRLIESGFSPGNPILCTFCSAQCNKDYLDYVYVEPLSPREKAAQAQNNNPPEHGDEIAAAVAAQFTKDPEAADATV